MMYSSIIVVIAIICIALDMLIYFDIVKFVERRDEEHQEEADEYFRYYNKWTTGAMVLEYISWVLTPLILLVFKGNVDMFSCFSKVGDMAMITIYQ